MQIVETQNLNLLFKVITLLRNAAVFSFDVIQKKYNNNKKNQSKLRHNKILSQCKFKLWATREKHTFAPWHEIFVKFLPGKMEQN